MSYNKLVADFIQHNHNISNSWEYQTEEMMYNYPFKNSFDEVVSTLYYLINEEEEREHSKIEDMFLLSKEIIFSLEACLRLLEKIKEKYTDNFNNISNNAEYYVAFKFTDERSIDDYINAYKMWLEGIKADK